MPGGIIANDDISWPFKFYIVIGMVQKYLKDFAVGVGEFQGIKLAGPGGHLRNRAPGSWPLSGPSVVWGEDHLQGPSRTTTRYLWPYRGNRR